MDTEELCVTVTDAAGCTANDCATMFAEDVRCSTGNNNNNKVRICHSTNSTSNPWVEICVANEAVPAHLAHGDYVGPCHTNVAIPADVITENSKPGFTIYPNPGNGNINITVNFADDNSDKMIRVLNMSGQIVKQINMKLQNRINITVEDAGVYLVQMISNKQVITKKLVVVR